MRWWTLGWIVGVVAGCSHDVGSDSVRSVPIAPTVEMGGSEDEALQWAELEGFVTSSTPGVPDVAHPLKLGMSEAETRAAIAQIAEPRIRTRQDVDLRGYRIIGALLRAHPDVGLTAIIDIATDTLDQIDLSVPSDRTMYLLTEAWGSPQITSHPELGPVASWQGDGLRVELASAPHRGRSVLKVRTDRETEADRAEATAP